MKKKICIISTIVILSALVFAGIYVSKNRFSLTINGSKIDKEEFLDAARRKQYDVTSYFSGKNGSNVDGGFWEQEIDGETPYEKLAKEALEELKYFHAVYGLAVEKGYVEDDSYAAFLKRWEAENALRKEKIEKGEVVYGLSEYTLELYREYEMDVIQKSYCQDLENEGMEISDADRAQYYSEHEASYKREDDRILDYVKIPYEEYGIEEAETKKLKKQLTAIYKKLDESNSLEALAKEEASISPWLYHSEVREEELSMHSRMISDILEYAWDLEEGESTPVLDENGCLYLIACTERTSNEKTSLDEMKDNINKTLREQRYDAIIEQRAADSKVECDMEQIYLFMKKNLNN